ncbi:MAG TPA: YjbH domain-containing protein [Burkholderiaceae bacterium]
MVELQKRRLQPVNPLCTLRRGMSLASLLCTAGAACAGEPWFMRHERPSFDVPALAVSSPSGGMTIPDGRTLPDGTAVVGFNNTLEPQFYRYARADNYQFGIGLFRYLEISGRLANFPSDPDGTIGVRDLSANIKLSLPKLLRYQPDIAIGANDVGGGAPYFRSRYIAVSEAFGPLRLTVGAARGEPYLSRVFGGAQLHIGTSGLSVLVERNNQAYYGGVRYGSAPIAALGDARVLVTGQRSFGAHAPDGGKFVTSSLGLNLVIPLGPNTRHATRPVAVADSEPLWTPPPQYAAQAGDVAPRENAANGQATGTWRSPAASASASTLTPVPLTPVPALTPAPALTSVPALTPVHALTSASTRQLLQAAQAQLAGAGLERLRVGIGGDTLIIEFENHRFNRNEADAIGLVLGVGAMLAPPGVQRIAAIAKKANAPLYKVAVEQADYRQFLRDGDSGAVRPGLTFQFRPSEDGNVQWLDVSESAHGLSRIRIDPVLTKFVGTEIGVFDYSLAANVQAFVPLWKGAELSTSYVATVAESDNFAPGLLDYARQPTGLRTALLSQSFWLSDRTLNVLSVGKFMGNGRGVQNETVYFVPGRDDQVRLQYTYIRHPNTISSARETKSGSLSYLWNYQPLNVSIEASYVRYAGQDRGPTVQASRWFGDVQAQVFIRRSNIETRIGFGLAFPLTPRAGMRPGWTHLEGASGFPARLETKWARSGECNCITTGVVQEIPLIYSSRSHFLNQGRIGKDYLLSQLQRMREAVLVFATLVP